MAIIILQPLGLSWFGPIPNLWKRSLQKELKGNLRPANKYETYTPKSKKGEQLHSPLSGRRGLKLRGILISTYKGC